MESIKDNPVYQWIKKLPNVPLWQNKSLKEILIYKNISLWWFIEGFIFYAVISPYIIKRYSKKYSFFRHLVLFYKLIIQCLAGKIITLFFNKHNTICYKCNSNKKALFVSYTVNWRANSDPKIKIPKKDIQFGEIIENLNKRGWDLIALQYDTSIFMNVSTLFEKIKYQPGLWMPMETYLNFSIIVKTLKSIKIFDKIWWQLKNNNKFKDLLKFQHSEDTSRELLNEFELYFQYYIPKSILYLEIMKRAIEIEKPNVIILTDEYSFIGLISMFAGKIMKIPVLAIQHGTIGPFYFSYIYMKNEVSTSIEDINKHPIADKTAVFGSYDKKTLTELSAYPKDSIVVTGRPSYDVLARADEIFDREKTFEKLNLDKNKKLIVWTTNSHVYTKEANEKLFNGVYKAIKELSNSVQLVIKLHPNEFDTTLHKEIAKKVGVKPAIIKDIDIYEILYSCDVMLTEFSTTGIEAAILGKLIITLHFAGQPDVAGYVKEGVALGVYKEEDLIINIKKALYDKQTQEKLKKAREKFVYEHAYKQDGKAAERVCDLIEEMIKNNV